LDEAPALGVERHLAGAEDEPGGGDGLVVRRSGKGPGGSVDGDHGLAHDAAPSVMGRDSPAICSARISAERAWAGSPSARARSASGAASAATAPCGISTTSWMRTNTPGARP